MRFCGLRLGLSSLFLGGWLGLGLVDLGLALGLVQADLPGQEGLAFVVQPFGGLVADDELALVGFHKGRGLGGRDDLAVFADEPQGLAFAGVQAFQACALGHLDEAGGGSAGNVLCGAVGALHGVRHGLRQHGFARRREGLDCAGDVASLGRLADLGRGHGAGCGGRGLGLCWRFGCVPVEESTQAGGTAAKNAADKARLGGFGEHLFQGLVWVVGELGNDALHHLVGPFFGGFIAHTFADLGHDAALDGGPAKGLPSWAKQAFHASRSQGGKHASGKAGGDGRGGRFGLGFFLAQALLHVGVHGVHECPATALGGCVDGGGPQGGGSCAKHTASHAAGGQALHDGRHAACHACHESARHVGALACLACCGLVGLGAILPVAGVFQGGVGACQACDCAKPAGRQASGGAQELHHGGIQRPAFLHGGVELLHAFHVVPLGVLVQPLGERGVFAQILQSLGCHWPGKLGPHGLGAGLGLGRGFGLVNGGVVGLGVEE